jgi:exopolyphosphatase/guanosine-5'-triphosphate,3'-diphosphate pyrophosphatase
VTLAPDLTLTIKPEKISKPTGSTDLYAALDLGSNSFHLLVARFEGSKLVVVDRHKESVRLAEGLDAKGKLDRATIARALDSLRRFAERLRSTPVSHFRVVGTNTLRVAKNADAFLEQAEEILQSPVHIISGSEEARLIYLGVANDLSPQDHRRLVVDIGGGSTELIVGGDLPEHLESLHIGCVDMTRRYFADGKLSSKSYRQAVLEARGQMQPAVMQFGSGNWDEAVGSSGTVRAVESLLSALDLDREHLLKLDGLEALAQKLCEFKRVEEVDWPDLNDERRRVLPGGLAVLHGVFLELGISQMAISSYSIREGIILDLAGRIHNRDTRADTVRSLMHQYRVDAGQAQRVQDLAVRLLAQSGDYRAADSQRVQQLLSWAASLHEIGLSVAHSGFHKHGAYLLLHSDMPGFSRQEQKLISFLVLNHRRKLRTVPKAYGFQPDWRLVVILRLACLLCRRRDDAAVPENIAIDFHGRRKASANNGDLRLTLDRAWLDDHPLTAEDLKIEQGYLQGMNIKLEVETKP